MLMIDVFYKLMHVVPIKSKQDKKEKLQVK